MKINFLKNEYWYGGSSDLGFQQPISETDSQNYVLKSHSTANQVQPFFVSSKGRFIASQTAFNICFNNGVINIDEEVTFRDGFDNLKNAYKKGMQEFFPFQKISLSQRFFDSPVYNTWIELTFYQNQIDVLKYAKGIVDHQMEPGILMIDDGWSQYYGKWEFDLTKFPTPKKMISELSILGFETMLWICPFITPDTVEFREALTLDYLVKNPDNSVYIASWWNGYSAVLDVSNPKALDWLENQLSSLIDLGIVGFKFDAGDSAYFKNDNVNYGNCSPNEMSEHWAKFGAKFEYNEFRVTFNAGGLSIYQRLADKKHSWKENGISSLIPNSLTQGITGHPFSSPDMVGGGEYIHFQEAQGSGLDEELVWVYAQIACLMPSIQFSAAPWRILDKENFNYILNSLEIRKKYLPFILKAFNESKQTGLPMINYMEFVFPHEGMASITDQFMLGNTILVAPFTKKGEATRIVHLPKGTWRYNKEILVSTGEKITLTPLKKGYPIILELLEGNNEI